MLTRIMALLRTGDDHVLPIVRVALGFVMFAHGAQKALGWFGGPGMEPTLTSFAQNFGISAPLALLAIAAEFLGGAFLIFGLLARLSAFGIAVNMIVAVLLVHLPYGLFMNWSGTQKGEGIEYHILALALSAILVARGAGAWSVDRILAQKLSSSQGAAASYNRTDRPIGGVPRAI
jgi:putative oxidoreductase